jgi:signal transduction histidine kinase
VRWWERVGAWDETQTFAVDAWTAAGFVALLVPVSFAIGTQTAAPWWFWTLALGVPLAWRRTHPAASAAAVFSVALVHMLAGGVVVPGDVLVLVALYSVTVHGPVWAYRTAILGALAGGALLGVELAFSTRVVGLIEAAVVTVAFNLLALSVFAFGLVRRARREAIDGLRDKTRRLQIERDQEAQIATAAERARIAREMHDIVAHSLSVIIAQADGGRYAAEHDAAAAQRSLTTISETGRAALADMRRLLGVLRPTEPAGDHSPAAAPAVGAPEGPRQRAVADLTPQPHVDDIADLVAQVRASGVNASLVRMGTPRPLPPGTGLTVFRICQESLTNILKHAGPEPTATVLLQWKSASLLLEVTDDGRGAAAESDDAGQGVLGMRERAAMLGGSLTVGPRPGGGFRVRAEIPIPPLEGQ